MLAWHCEPELKAKTLERLREHRRLDEIVQRVYWEGGRGCNLGCLTHVNENTHEAASRMFGLPMKVCYWLEAVFEGLPQNRCADWVVHSAEAIPVGADLSLVHHVFLAWLLRDSGLLTITDCNRTAISTVASLHDRAAAGVFVADDEWSAAARSAASAAAAAAWSAAWSAESAARSAESAARSAESASAAARSERSAARSAAAAWIKIADKSIEIFSAAPVKNCYEFEPDLYCDAITPAVPVLV